MTQDQIERCDALWRELLADGRVRWMAGMLVRSSNNYHRPARIESLDGDDYGLTVIPDADGPVFAAHHEYGIAGSFPRESTRPVWTDPATIGCLVAMAREATGDAEASCVVYNGRWHCDWHGNETIAETEPEALLLAIQAATA